MKVLTLFLLVFCVSCFIYIKVGGLRKLMLLISKSTAKILWVDEKWDAERNAIHLINLTMIMCKDAMLKLRMADRIQEDYKNSFAYELGLLASGIMDKFKHMLAIYKNFSNPRTFKDVHRREKTVLYLNAYHVMQSDYNEIREERDLFLDIVEQHRIRKDTKGKKASLLAKFAASHPGIDISKFTDLKNKPNNRRSMQNVDPIETEDKLNSKITMELNKRVKLMEKPKVKKTEWAKNNNAAEAEYKKKLRYIKWADKWQKFNPEIEGVDIPDKLAKIGFTNTSNFLLKEFKGTI